MQAVKAITQARARGACFLGARSPARPGRRKSPPPPPAQAQASLAHWTGQRQYPHGTGHAMIAS
jgi:hypothetical protein